MVQKTSTTQSVWSELWHEDPALYLALQSTAIINNALLTLFLLAAFSIIYDMLRFWFRRRFFHAFDPPVPEPLSKLPSEPYKSFTSLNAKAAFYTTLFLVIQFATSYLVTHLSWLLADTALENRNLRRRCSRLHARGLECSTAAHYHDALNITGAFMLLVFIRGLELHVKQPRSRTRDDNYSPGFLRLKAACRWFIQMLLAVPIAVVYLYTRAARQRPWSCLRLLLVQAAASCAVFLLGNFVCLVAALPDFQETMERLEGSGIMGVRG